MKAQITSSNHQLLYNVDPDWNNSETDGLVAMIAAERQPKDAYELSLMAETLSNVLQVVEHATGPARELPADGESFSAGIYQITAACRLLSLRIQETARDMGGFER